MAYKYIKGKNKIRGEQTFVDNVSGSTYISASYFVGDGSLLTNVSGTGGGTANGQGPTGSLQFKSGSSGAISGSSDLVFDYTIPKFTVNSGFVVNRTSVSGNVSLTAAQHIIGVNTAVLTGNVTLSLPNASSLSNGQMYIIKDEGGEADTYNIIISCSSGQTIDGASTVTIESPYAAVNVYCNGNDKYFIY